jgi:hypothetical protein
MTQGRDVDTALQQAKKRVLELLDKVKGDAGGGLERVQRGWIDNAELEDDFYDTVTDPYTELRESIDLLFQFVDREHRTNISLARQLGVAEERQRSQLTQEQSLITGADPREVAENRLWHDGKVWHATYNGDTRKLGKLLGMLYIGYALEHPGPMGINMLDIEMTVYGKTSAHSTEDAMDAHAEIAGGRFDDEGYDDEEHDSGMRYAHYSEITSTGDIETLDGYRESRRQLKQQLYVAQEAGNTAEVGTLKHELGAIDAYIGMLEQSTKRGPTNEGDSKEHIKRVREATNYALAQLPSKHPLLAQHLDEALRIESNSIIYEPAAPTKWLIERPS